MKGRYTWLAVCVLGVLGPGAPSANTPIGWPYSPHGQAYPIGNSYGEYQRYDGDPSFHDGVDILAGSPRAVYALRDGTVTHLVTGLQLYSGIVIGEPRAGGTALLYWHLDGETIRPNLGETVAAGDYLGHVVEWPLAAFTHIHLSHVMGDGEPPGRYSPAIGDPLAGLVPGTDANAPVIEQAAPGAQFLFCRDETDTYLGATALAGRVDIVARVHDRFNSTAWKLAPHALRWSVTDAAGAVVAHGRPVVLDGRLGDAATVVRVLYKTDQTAQSLGDYENREFYVVVTNGTDDRPLTLAHGAGAWDTKALPNGVYTVTVEAVDRAGNRTRAQMPVTIHN